MSSFATFADASFHGLVGVSRFDIEDVIPGFGKDEVSKTSTPNEEGSPFFASNKLIATPFSRGKLDAGLAYAGLGDAQADTFRPGLPESESRCFS